MIYIYNAPFHQNDKAPDLMARNVSGPRMDTAGLSAADAEVSLVPEIEACMDGGCPSSPPQIAPETETCGASLELLGVIGTGTAGCALMSVGGKPI
jgi:hypothetical protein